MEHLFTRLALALVSACIGAPAIASPSICIGTMTEIELVHRVRQDAYFMHDAPVGRRLHIEYDGCGYRIHVVGNSPGARGGDLLLVDRHGRVTRVVHEQ